MRQGADTPLEVQAEVLRLRDTHKLSYEEIIAHVRKNMGYEIGSISTVSRICKRYGNRKASAAKVEEAAFGNQASAVKSKPAADVSDLLDDVKNLVKSVVRKLKAKEDWTAKDLESLVESVTKLAEVEALSAHSNISGSIGTSSDLASAFDSLSSIDTLSDAELLERDGATEAQELAEDPGEDQAWGQAGDSLGNGEVQEPDVALDDSLRGHEG